MAGAGTADERAGPNDDILLRSLSKKDIPVVFISPYEHHANEIMWRESIAEVACHAHVPSGSVTDVSQVVTIPEDLQGHIDTEVLEEQLKKYSSRKVRAAR